MVRLNPIFHLEDEPHGVALVEKTVVTARNTGEKKIGEKKRYAGTVYQALQLFLDASLKGADGDLVDVLALVEKTMGEIASAKARIMEEFRTEVYISRGKNNGG